MAETRFSRCVSWEQEVKALPVKSTPLKRVISERMNAHHFPQSDLKSGSREVGGTLQSPSGQLTRPVLARVPVTVSSPVGNSASANGRVLPVVYLKMQQREQIVPVVSRSGNLISTIGPKISTAPSGTISSLSGNQAGFVTIQGPIRSLPQGSSAQSTQPHIITLPKVASTALTLSNQQLITLQSVGANQSNAVPQPQYVTIQAPIVSKTQQNSGSLSSGQVQPQYVTIRTPVLTPSGSGVSSASQSQYVTIQAPVVQAGGQTTPSQTATYIPVSSVGQTSVSSVKSPVTYQVLKSNVKTGEQHVMYPVSVANIMPSSQPKMMIAPVTMMPKMSVVQSGGSGIAAQGSSDLISSSSTIGSIKLNSPQFSTKLINSAAVNLLQGKPVQTISLRKDGLILPNSDGQTGISQSKVLMPAGVSVSSASSSSPTQGFINLTISNGHIQPTGSKMIQGSPRIEKIVKDASVLPDTNTKSPMQSVITTPSIKNIDNPSDAVSVDKVSDGKDCEQKISDANEVIDIKSLLKSRASPNTTSIDLKMSENTIDSRSDSIGQKSHSDSNEGKVNTSPKADSCQAPASPINLFCEEGDLAHSPPNEQPQPKYTITMSDNPDEDIQIQLVNTDGPIKDKDAPASEDNSRSSTTNSQKPLLKKSSPKLLSKGGSTKGQSLLRNPAAGSTVSGTTTTPSPKTSKPSNKGGVKSILKPQGAKKPYIKTEMPDLGTDGVGESMSSPGDTKDSFDSPISPLTTSSFEDFDVVAALEWKNGVGLLPGSNLKFRMNEFGIMEMVSDDDDKSIKKGTDKETNSDSEGLMIDEGSNSSIEGKPVPEITEKKLSSSDDVYCCETCNVYGLASEFLSERFCTQACSAAFTVKKAWQYRREQDLRALRLRRKKRRLEQQRLAREKAEQAMQNEDSKGSPSQLMAKVLKKVKSIASENTSDADDSMEDPASMDSQLPLSPTSTSNSSDKPASSHPIDEDAGKLVKQRPASNFTWSKYLDMVKAKSAPSKLFKDPFPYGKNGFKVGMKLEGIDPERPSIFCVLTVAEVKGYRLKLHFDGYPENYDFWVNADSPEIFQPGWCEKNMRKLTPPKGHSTFNWNTYLKMCKSTAAPKILFSNKSSASNVCPNGFRVGMKLEAVDKKNSSLVCVASIADIVDGRCLIHFDSWDEIYDYWADPSSPYIHPVGWCEEHDVTLTPPNQYKDPSMFSWDKYLKETKTLPAPSRAFKARPPNGFKRGMRLEAVDKRVPHLIRVATVDDVHDHTIRIRFDGWPDEYSYWVDDDSPDIHPAGWCLETKHPLEPPLSEEDIKCLARCGIPGCRGEGHVKGSRYTTHITPQNCPYAPENLLKDSHLPDRLTSSSDNVDLEESSTLPSKKDHKPDDRSIKWKRLLHHTDEQEFKRPKLSDDDIEVKNKPSLLISMQQKLQSELERSVVDPGYQIETGAGRPALWIKHSQPLHESPMVRDAVNPQQWTIEDVLEFLSSIPCLEEYGRIFKEQDIDGEALLMLTQSELVSNMKLKLGHAIRLYNCIVILRQKCL